MKVYIPNSLIPDNYLKGKSLFCNKLGWALKDLGVDITNDDNQQVDIALNVIRLSDKCIKNAKINVLRLNGVYHNTDQDYTAKNAGIKRSFEQCDAVIYQSLHSQRLCDKFLGTPNNKRFTVIYNGSQDVRPINNFGGPTISRARKHVAITFSKWRPHKRLRDILESFLLAKVKDSILYIAGDTAKSGLSSDEQVKYMSNSRLLFLGPLNRQDMHAYLKISDVSIHLCWFDACPNSVVEALCLGVPVISNNVGGTHELLHRCNLRHLICNIDQPYDYKPVDLYNPPTIDRGIVASQIRCVFGNKSYCEVNSQSLHISNVAKEYKRFFESLL